MQQTSLKHQQMDIWSVVFLTKKLKEYELAGTN